MALKLDILANTTQAQREVKDLSKALDGTSDALDDVAKDSEQSADKMERSFRDMVRSADKTGKGIGTNLDDGFDKAKRGADDFKDEAKGTAREVAASFDGSAESIAGGFQEIAANALAGFGPLGAGVGVALAAGIGTGMQALEKFNEALDTSREAAFDFASDIEGRADIAAQIASWTTDMERFKQAQDIAYATGRDVAGVIADLATGGDSLDDLRQAFFDMSYETDLTLGRVTELNGVLTGTKEGFERGAVAAQAQEQAVKNLGEQQRTEISKTKAAIDSLTNSDHTVRMKFAVDSSAAYREIDALRRIAERGINIAFNNTGRMLME